MSTPARTGALFAGATGTTADKHQLADLLARIRVYVGIVLLILGMSLSIPSAQTADWLTVLSYLSITAAGLCLIFTGSVRRQGIRAQRDAQRKHDAIRSELSRLAAHIEMPKHSGGNDDVTGELSEYLAALDDLHRDQGGE